MRYRLSAPADKDLDEIWAHIAKDKPAAADRFLDKLFDKFSLLAAHPQHRSPCERISPGLHRFPVGNYMLFYRVTSGYIEIVRVLHGARDIDELLGSD